MIDDYSDIIDMPHYEPCSKHPRMSIYNRSAQFAPFSALVGYEDAVKETARLTDKRIDIDDGLKDSLNRKLSIIQNNINLHPKIKIKYYIPDQYKKGGKYIEKDGNVKKIDNIERYILMTDKTKIFFNNIVSITSEELNIDD